MSAIQYATDKRNGTVHWVLYDTSGEEWGIICNDVAPNMIAAKKAARHAQRMYDKTGKVAM